ncbi:CDK5RAP3-like protein [Platanthera guangdongensis]|uniref:CDK5RAP3-like protein n=1 Tax=Platanthera guangdongensis TaxID=2320717 RepID=A0ABR2LNK8_9ASPA
MRSEDTSSLQQQVQAVAPIVLQQYAPDALEVFLSELSLAISLLTDRRTRDFIMILNSKRFLDRLVSTLEEKKQHEVKLRNSLRDLAERKKLDKKRSATRVIRNLRAGEIVVKFGQENVRAGELILSRSAASAEEIDEQAIKS